MVPAMDSLGQRVGTGHCFLLVLTLLRRSQAIVDFDTNVPSVGFSGSAIVVAADFV